MRILKFLNEDIWLSFASSSWRDSKLIDYTGDCDAGPKVYQIGETFSLEWGSVWVLLLVFELWSEASGILNKDSWKDKKDEWSAETASDCDHGLWVSPEEDDSNNWQRKDYRPNALDTILVVIE